MSQEKTPEGTIPRRMIEKDVLAGLCSGTGLPARRAGENSSQGQRYSPKQLIVLGQSHRRDPEH